MLLDDIAQKIKSLHVQHSQTISLGLAVAREMGGLLIEAKEKICPGETRGGFCQWIEENLPFGRQTATFYMRIHRNWDRISDQTPSGAPLNKTRASEILGGRKPRGDRTGETVRYDLVKAAQAASGGDLVGMLVGILLERDDAAIILEKVQKQLSAASRRRRLAV